MNALADWMIPDITTMIRMDHSHALALFHRYKQHASAAKKRALISNACLALEVHAQLEEEIFYPALRGVIAEDAVLQKSEPEHNEMRRIIEDLRAGLAAEQPAGDTGHDDRFFELMRLVIHHVADEESQLLPAAERLMGDRLSSLGIEMTKRRIELLKPHAGELVVSATRSFPVGAALLTAGAVAIGALLLSRSKSAPRRGARRWP
ncbi:MAG TPA: hemerythrin domain-containing protein [Steroidobacteraceae bacterium]|nr:hemerythrin domain-containing protein [Steroidobacteraceae bacterium]